MEQQIGYCTTSDGVRIAFATYGEAKGRPLVLVESWYYSQTLEWAFPPARGLLEQLGKGRPLVTYDRRGKAASQRDVDDFSMEAQVSDVSAVVDHLALDRFDMLGFDPVISVAYAAHHAERVSRLVLWMPYTRGGEIRVPEAGDVVELARNHWPAYRRMMATSGFPTGPLELQRWFSNMMRDAISPQVAARYVEFETSVDISGLLPELRMPTLVVHPRGPRPATASQKVAASISDARIVALEGDTGTVFLEPTRMAGIVHEFLDSGRVTVPAVGRSGSSSMTAILFADIADSTALTERLGDAAFRDKARELDEALRRAISSNGGTAIDGKLLGDGVLATFGAAREAIACASAIHDAGSQAELALHVGIHAGDVIREANNVYGGAVNIASRISGEAAAGETLVSATVRDLARTSAGVSFEDRGECELKGVSEPVRVYAVRSE